MAVYENPLNGKRVTVGSLGPFLGALFFGGFYFLVKGSVKHFFVSWLVAICTVGVSWLIYPFFAPGIIRRMYEDKGFVQMSGGSPSRKSGMKKCPHCAEYVRNDASVCRHCGNPTSAPTSGRPSGGKQIRLQSKQPPAPVTPAAPPAARPAPVAQSIVVECPSCQKSLSVPDTSTGARYTCPHCGQTLEMG